MGPERAGHEDNSVLVCEKPETTEDHFLHEDPRCPQNSGAAVDHKTGYLPKDRAPDTKCPKTRNVPGDPGGRRRTREFRPWCGRHGMKTATLTAQSACAREKVPTHPTRSCPGPAGHPALFRAGSPGCSHPAHPAGASRPTEGGSAGTRHLPVGAESLAGTRAPGPGGGNRGDEFVPFRSREAGGTEAGLAASTPGSTVGVQAAKSLVRTGRSGPGYLRVSASSAAKETVRPRPASVHSRSAGCSPLGAYSAEAGVRRTRKYVTRPGAAGRKRHLPEHPAEEAEGLGRAAEADGKGGLAGLASARCSSLPAPARACPRRVPLRAGVGARVWTPHRVEFRPEGTAEKNTV